MAISDLNILCIGQESPSFGYYDGVGIDFLDDHNGYGKHWLALKKCVGCWYQLFPVERVMSHEYNDEFFDCRFCGESYYVVICRKYLPHILSAIEAYLNISPVGEILLLIRLDEHGESENEITIRLDEFEKKLKFSQIRFNTIYRIHKQDTTLTNSN